MDNKKADPKTPEDLAKAIFRNADRKLQDKPETGNRQK